MKISDTSDLITTHGTSIDENTETLRYSNLFPMVW